MSKHHLEIRLYPSKAAVFLGGIVIFLLLAHIIVNYLKWTVGNDFTLGLERLFDLDTERNIPTLFAICLWMINAALLFMIWKVQSLKYRRQGIWLILSGLFCFFALDELSSIHEKSVPYLRAALDASGIFYFAWVIPYGIGVIFLTILMLPIIWKLDHKIRLWFVSSAVTFVTGAIGLEMLEGKYLEMMNGQRDFVYFSLMTFEESMEMAGLVMLVYASLLLLQKECGGFWVHFPAVRSAPLSSNKPDAGDGR